MRSRQRVRGLRWPALASTSQHASNIVEHVEGCEKGGGGGADHSFYNEEEAVAAVHYVQKFLHSDNEWLSCVAMTPYATRGTGSETALEEKLELFPRAGGEVHAVGAFQSN